MRDTFKTNQAILSFTTGNKLSFVNPPKGMEPSEMDLIFQDDLPEEELPDGGVLRYDIELALHPRQFPFPGFFYHAGIHPTAPNPCLEIDGFGVVDLPLAEGKIMALVTTASPIPNDDTRHAWEIEADRIKFGNPLWEKWVKGTCKDLCARLGVEIKSGGVPKMELLKLHVFGTGSESSLGKISKADGACATVVVFLPTKYTGGQVAISSSTTTRTFNFAPQSLSATALLAWHKGAQYRTKPITSGFRLALVYNLVHPSSNYVRPALPITSAIVSGLRHILRKWKRNGYSTGPPSRYFAYLLSHHYGLNKLKNGERCLKALDRQRVAVLQDAAAPLGFTVGLATVEHFQRGAAYHEDESEGDIPEMEEVVDEDTFISGFVDLEGNPLLKLDRIDVSTEEESLIPYQCFEGMKPTGQKYEQIEEGARGVLELLYRQTVVIVFHRDDKDQVLSAPTPAASSAAPSTLAGKKPKFSFGAAIDLI